MRPGTYIRLRREAARLSIEDVAARVETAPRYSEIDRVAWLHRIESDIATLSPDVAASLDRVFPMSRYVLARLIDLRSYGDLGIEMPRICGGCGCSETDPCINPVSGAACEQEEPLPGAQFCTACTTREEKNLKLKETARAA